VLFFPFFLRLANDLFPGLPCISFGLARLCNIHMRTSPSPSPKHVTCSTFWPLSQFPPLGLGPYVSGRVFLFVLRQLVCVFQCFPLFLNPSLPPFGTTLTIYPIIRRHKEIFFVPRTLSLPAPPLVHFGSELIGWVFFNGFCFPPASCAAVVFFSPPDDRAFFEDVPLWPHHPNEAVKRDHIFAIRPDPFHMSRRCSPLMKVSPFFFAWKMYSLTPPFMHDV